MGDFPILNNNVCDLDFSKTDGHVGLALLGRDSGKYNLPTSTYKMDLRTIACFLESKKGNLNFIAAVARLLIRFAEHLIQEKDYATAYEIIQILEGRGEASQIKRYVTELKIDLAYIQGICKASESNDNPFDFPYAKYIALKADALKGLKKYKEAIPLYEKVLTMPTEGKWSDCGPFVLVALFEAKVNTGAITGAEADEKSTELQQKLNSFSLTPDNKQKLLERIRVAAAVAKKDYAAIDQELGLQVGKASGSEKTKLLEQQAWNYINWAKTIAFANPDAPKGTKSILKPNADAEVALAKLDLAIEAVKTLTPNEDTKKISATAYEAKITILVLQAETNIASNFKLANEKLQLAKGICIDKLKKDAEILSGIAWTYGNYAKSLVFTNPDAKKGAKLTLRSELSPGIIERALSILDIAASIKKDERELYETQISILVEYAITLSNKTENKAEIETKIDELVSQALQINKEKLGTDCEMKAYILSVYSKRLDKYFIEIDTKDGKKKVLNCDSVNTCTNAANGALADIVTITTSFIDVSEKACPVDNYSEANVLLLLTEKLIKFKAYDKAEKQIEEAKKYGGYKDIAEWIAGIYLDWAKSLIGTNNDLAFEKAKKAKEYIGKRLPENNKFLSAAAWLFLDLGKAGHEGGLNQAKTIAESDIGGKIKDEDGNPGKYIPAVIDTLVKNGRFDEAIGLCLIIKSFKYLKYAFWEKIKSEGENNPDSLEDRIIFAVILKASVNEKDSAINEDFWAGIKDEDKKKEIKDKVYGYLKIFTPHGFIEDRLDMAQLLESIAGTFKNTNKKDESDKYLALANLEYEKCDGETKQKLERDPTQETAANRALVCYKIGLAKAKSDDLAEKADSTKYLTEAGYLYELLLGLKDDEMYGFEPSYSIPRGKVKPFPTGIIARSDIPRDEFGKIEQLFINPNAPGLVLKPDTKESDINEIKTSKKIQALLLKALEERETYVGRLKSYLEILGKTKESLPKTEKDRIAKIEVAQKAIEKLIEDLGGKLGLSAKALSLVREGKPKDAITLILADNGLPALLKADPENMEEISYVIGVLAYAYEEAGRQANSQTPPDAKTAKEYFAKAIAIYQALLYKTKTSIGDPKLEEVIDFILKDPNRQEITRVQEKQEFSGGKLHWKLAKALQMTGDLVHAKDEFQKALALYRPDSIEATQIQIDLLVVASSAIKELIESKDYAGALRIINEYDLDSIAGKIESMRTPDNAAIIFNAYRTLSWMYGMKAEAEKGTEKPKESTKDYIKAAEIAGKLLEFTDDIISKSEIIESPSVKRPMTRADILLAQAGYLQGAGKEDPSQLDKSLALYKEVLKRDTAKILYIKASTGLAQVLLEQAANASMEAKGKITNPEELKQRLLQIKAALIDPASQALAGAMGSLESATSGDIETFMETLSWLLSAVTDIRRKTDTTLKDGALPVEQALLLVLQRALIKGMKIEDFERLGADDPWKKIYLQAEGLTDFKLNTILKAANKDYDAKHWDSWKLKASFVNNLIAAKLYSEALVEYNSISSQLDVAFDSLDEKDKLETIGLKVSIASILCFHFKDYDSALIVIDTVFASKSLIASKTELLAQVYNIKAAVLANKGDTKGAIELLKEMIRLLGANFDSLIEDYESHLDDHFDQQTTTDLTKALLSLADLYNYERKSRKEAAALYKIAGTWARNIEDPAERRLAITQSMLGIANLLRLRDTDYEGSIRYFDLGIDVLLETKEGVFDADQDSQVKDLLVDLYQSKALALANMRAKSVTSIRQDNGSVARIEASPSDLLKAAATIVRSIGTKTEKEEKMDKLRRTSVAVQQGRLGVANMIRVGTAYVRDVYSGSGESKPAEGWMFFAEAHIPIHLVPKVTFDVKYTRGIAREMKVDTAGMKKGEKITRTKIGNPHTISTDVSLNRQGDRFNLRASLGLDTTIAHHSINHILWNRSFTKTYRQGGVDGTFYSIYPKASVGGDLKIQLPNDILMMFGMDLFASVLATSSTTPLEKDQQQAEKEGLGTSDDIARKPNAGERVSGGGQVYARFDHIFTLNDNLLFRIAPAFGFGLERNPRLVTANGLWPIANERSTTYSKPRFADFNFFAGLSGEFLLPKSGMRFPFNFNYQQSLPFMQDLDDNFRNLRTISAGLGFGFDIIPGTVSLDILFNFSRSTDTTNHGSSDAYGGLLELRL